MHCWARGEALEYPPLPVIPGVGEVPYHADCDFESIPPVLWPPEDLRRFLNARYMECVASMRPKVYVPVCVYDEETGLQLPHASTLCASRK